MSDRNTLSVVEGSLVVIPRGMDKVWGFKKRIVVPLTAIADVQIERSPHRVRSGWRGPGLDAFGKKSGSFHPGSETHYWNFSGRGEVLMVEIVGGRPFHRLYLSVADAEASRAMISEALHLAQ